MVHSAYWFNFQYLQSKSSVLRFRTLIGLIFARQNRGTIKQNLLYNKSNLDLQEFHDFFFRGT